MQKQNNIVLLTTLLTFIGLTTFAMDKREETAEVEEGSESSPQFTRETTTLHLAVQINDEKLVKMFLKYFPDDINCQDEKGRTPLDIAEKKGFESIAKLLRSRLASLQAHGGQTAEKRKRNDDPTKEPNPKRRKLNPQPKEGEIDQGYEADTEDKTPGQTLDEIASEYSPTSMEYVRTTAENWVLGDPLITRLRMQGRIILKEADSIEEVADEDDLNAEEYAEWFERHRLPGQPPAAPVHPKTRRHRRQAVYRPVAAHTFVGQHPQH